MTRKKRKTRRKRRRIRKMNFRSKEAYRKWLAYGHIHGVFKRRRGVKVYIRGKPHKVS